MVVALSTCSCGLGGVLVYMHVIYRVCIRAFSGPLLFSQILYRIVPSKRPWALAAQAPKFGVGGCTEKVLK